MSIDDPAGARIRVATLADAADIARLLTPLGYPVTTEEVAARWPAWEAEGNSALVVEEGATVVGLITLHRTTVLHRPAPLGRITSLIVDEGARGRGYGRALVAEAERELRALGCALVEVTSHMRRAEAHAFYQHLGYERTSYRFFRTLVDP